MEVPESRYLATCKAIEESSEAMKACGTALEQLFSIQPCKDEQLSDEDFLEHIGISTDEDDRNEITKETKKEFVQGLFVEDLSVFQLCKEEEVSDEDSTKTSSNEENEVSGKRRSHDQEFGPSPDICVGTEKPC